MEIHAPKEVITKMHWAITMQPSIGSKAPRTRHWSVRQMPIVQVSIREKQGYTGSRSGCLIATATYGSPQAGEVQLVRDYRDGMIRTSYAGSRFVEGFNIWYYSFSPAVAEYIENHPLVKSVMQVCLIPLLFIILFSQQLFVLMGFSKEAGLIIVLIFGAFMYGLVYISLPASVILVFAGRKGMTIPSFSVMKYLFVSFPGYAHDRQFWAPGDLFHPSGFRNSIPVAGMLYPEKTSHMMK